MIWLDDLKLALKIFFTKEFKWPALPEKDYVKGRLATSEDYFAKRASFFSVSDENPRVPADDVAIPQYALHIKNHLIKIPCIIIQVEGNSGVHLVGYKNLINGENGVGWINEFKLLGDRPLPKNEW